MLIKNFTNDKFIRAYNSFANVESQFYLNDEEFYMYSVLFTNQMMDGSIRTNIDILNQFSPIRFIKEETKNKRKIHDLISSLIKKNVLIVETEYEKLKNNTLLELTINDMGMSNDGVAEDKKTDEVGKFKNFSKIPFSKFLTFTSTKDYYIYYTVSRWSKGFNFSYNSWAEVLGLKHQESALRVIEDAVKRGIIYKNIGDYNSRTRQDANVYSIYPFTEAQKSIQTKKVEQKQANEKREEEFGVPRHHSDEYEKEINEAMHFFKTYKDEDGSVFPQSHHYAMYLEVKENIKNGKSTKLEKEFIQSAEKRMSYLKNNPQFKKEFEHGEDMFRQQQKEKVFKQLESATNAIKMKDGSVVIVDKNNIDSIDWKDVRSTYFGDSNLNGDWEMVSFQPCDTITHVYENRPDMIEYGWELYKAHVKTGKMLTHTLREQIQSKTFNDKYSSSTNDTVSSEVVDYSLMMQEANERPYTSEDMRVDMMNQMENVYEQRKRDNDRNVSNWLDADIVF